MSPFLKVRTCPFCLSCLMGLRGSYETTKPVITTVGVCVGVCVCVCVCVCARARVCFPAVVHRSREHFRILMSGL